MAAQAGAPTSRVAAPTDLKTRMQKISERKEKLRLQTEATGPDTVLTWGKFKGKTFQEAYLSENYSKWCVEHLPATTENPNQQAFLKYIGEKLSEEEALLTQAEAEAEAAQPKATPPPACFLHASSESSAEWMKIGDPLDNRLTALEAGLAGMSQRVANLDRAFAEILAAVQASHGGG